MLAVAWLPQFMRAKGAPDGGSVAGKSSGLARKILECREFLANRPLLAISGMVSDEDRWQYRQARTLLVFGLGADDRQRNSGFRESRQMPDDVPGMGLNRQHQQTRRKPV
jgi:hypothetical protein